MDISVVCNPYSNCCNRLCLKVLSVYTTLLPHPSDIGRCKEQGLMSMPGSVEVGFRLNSG